MSIIGFYLSLFYNFFSWVRPTSLLCTLFVFVQIFFMCQRKGTKRTTGRVTLCCPLRLLLPGMGDVQIRLGSDPLCLHGTGSKLGQYVSTLDHLHKWTHLVPDSRSDPYRIHQVPCKHKAYPYQLRAGSKWIRSRVNAA